MNAQGQRVDVLAPSIGEGWDAWGAACKFKSWTEAAEAIGITKAQLVTNRKKAPRKTIRLAMDAVLAQRMWADGFPYVMLPQRPEPALGKVDGANAYSGVQMIGYGRDCANAQHAMFTTANPDITILIDAASSASATLGHAYHTVLTGNLADQAHADYQRLDAALARVGGAQS